MANGAHERIGLEAAAREAVEAGSFVSDVVHAVREGRSEWEVSSAPEEAPVWIYVDPPEPPAVDRGWKLHVSAALVSADDVLQRALPVLLEAGAPFKLAASLRVLEALNEGEAGLSQIGKFITAYPGDDSQAVNLATQLHEVTAGLRGPRVPSDRPLSEGSLVHYRFGAFDAPGSEDGTSEDPLAARAAYIAPEGVDDPFVAQGVATETKAGLLAGRYMLTSTIYRSARGAVHSAVDMRELRDLIVKRAARDARLGPDGLDARDGLRDEAAVLERLAGKGPWPEVVELVEHETDLLLVMTQVPGVPLATVVHRMFEAEKPPEGDLVVGWAGGLARALQVVHEQDLVYRDLNPANVIVSRDGGVALIDFELTRAVDSAPDFYAAGTPGFLSPQQAAGEPARPADDVYALGALIVFMALGQRPSGPADARAVAKRLGRSLGDVVARCLKERPSDRFHSMVDVGRALSEVTR